MFKLVRPIGWECVWTASNVSFPIARLQVVLSALLAVAAAKPSLIGSPLALDPWAHSAPLYAPLAVPSVARVGSVVSSIPTGISAHSSSVIHSHGAVVTPVVTPIQKTIVSAPLISAPIVKTISPYAYSAPLAYGAGWNNGWANGWNQPLLNSW